VLGEEHAPHKGHVVAGFRCPFFWTLYRRTGTKAVRLGPSKRWPPVGRRRDGTEQSVGANVHSSTCLIKRHTTKKNRGKGDAATPIINLDTR